MSEFKKENLENIKAIFQQKTGVTLPGSRKVRRPVKIALVLAAVIACLSISAFAGMQFSVLEGDDLLLSAVYEGEGIVAITVENRSDKLLEFEEKFYLRRWLGGSVALDMSAVRFENTAFAPNSRGVMHIDLSEACDVAALEQPLAENDYYYFLLTNNGFAFGQDWICGVDFSQPGEEAADVEVQPENFYIVPSSSEDSRAEVEESLRFYFENVSLDIVQRRQQAYDYIEAYTRLFEEFDGEIVMSVSPCLPGNRVDITKPLFSVSVPEHYREDTFNRWSGVDADYRIIATEGEYAYIVDAILPAGDYTATVPMVFILSYERDSISDEAYAFIHGRLISFAQLEQYKVYEGEGKVSYEVSALIYDDPERYIHAIDEQDGDSELDEAAVEKFIAMREYFLAQLGEMIYYRQLE